jgi:integrase
MAKKGKRVLERLTTVGILKQKTPGCYPDGGGLYLQVGPSGGKSWLFRFTLTGRSREMGLGALNARSLAEAREEARKCRGLLAAKIDPLEARRSNEAAAALDAAKSNTFKDCALAYITAHKGGWRSAKHVAQWENTLSDYAYQTIGSLPVAQIDTGLVMQVLEPIWSTKTETASRLRGRIESILDWARVRGFREGENPARWRGHLDKLLPRRTKVQQVTHHPALPYSEIGAFMGTLKAQEGIAARALEFIILTAARTGEAVNARWDEFDLEKGAWIVPAARMKTKVEHKVPLSPQVLQLLKSIPRIEGNPHVFFGKKAKKPLSNMACLVLLERMKRKDVTVHGFRSTFRDWAAENTAYPNFVVEMALAHTVSDKVEAAYRRGDLFEKRRRLMGAWADYCAISKGGSVHGINETRRRKSTR